MTPPPSGRSHGKASSYLDLWEQTAGPPPLEAASGQGFLRRIMAMLEKMIAT